MSGINTSAATNFAFPVDPPFDVDELTNQIVSAEIGTDLRQLDARALTNETRLSGLGSLQSALEGVSAAAKTLSNYDTNFVNNSTTSTDSSIAILSPTAKKDMSIALTVNSLATAHRLESSTFSSTTDTVGTGVLTFQFGTDNSGFTLNADKPTKTVTIGADDNSIAGIRDAVNDANIGVTANVIFDGTNYRLIFKSDDTGANNSLKITVDDDDLDDTNASGLSQLAYDPEAGVGTGKNLTQSQAAADASLVIDGVAVSNPSNSITNAIDDASIVLLKADPDKEVTLRNTVVTGDVSGSVSTFVDQYNLFAQTFSLLNAFDEESGEKGELAGDSIDNLIDSELNSILTNPIEGNSNNISALSQIGVTRTKEGFLQFDSTIFDFEMAADPDAIKSIFASEGTSSDTAKFTFESTTADTAVGEYTVSITTPATRGSLVGSSVADLTIDGNNSALNFTIDGINSIVTLTQGTYDTAADLAAEIQSRINGTDAFSSAGIEVAVTESSGVLSITSNVYGSDSEVTLVDGTGKTSLLGSSSTSTAGVDVIGVIGDSGTITGSGQTLTSDSGATKGLSINVKTTNTGILGSINYTVGLGGLVDTATDAYIKAGGLIDNSEDIINEDQIDIDVELSALQERETLRLEQVRDELTAVLLVFFEIQTQLDQLEEDLKTLPGNVKKSS